MYIARISLLIVTLLSMQMVHAEEGSCLNDAAIQKKRSEELQVIVNEDQQARELPISTNEEAQALIEQDMVRRKRVAEIFAEGCLKTAKDFAAAALVFQHGDVPEHYFLAFLFSKKGVELGDEAQKRMMGLTIDRYLVSQGKKQLFASQFFNSSMENPCFCMEPVESIFPESLRQSYTGVSLDERWDWLTEFNEGRCETAYCDHVLKDTPKGSVVGFW